MNHTVRTYLINTAREREKFVYYSDLVKSCDLGFDLNTPEGLLELKQILTDISRFENSNQRPMLTSLAIGKKENDHGNGFYDLAEEFGFGKNKDLHESYWGMQEASRTRDFWQKEDHFLKYAELHTLPVDNSRPAFFTKGELDFFKQWQLQPYDPENEEHIDAKNELIATVWDKSKYLGKLITDQMTGFKSDGKRIWHQRGWKENLDGDNVQAAIFKPYGYSGDTDPPTGHTDPPEGFGVLNTNT